MKLASGLILGLSILVAGCGSGGSGSTVVTVSPTPTPTPLPPAAYFMVPNRFEAAVSFGAPTSVGFSSTAQNGDTSYTVQLVANGLPAGVSASFSPNPAPARSPFVMTLNATANAAFAQNLPFIVVATRSVDGVQTKVTMVVDSVPPPGQLANNRSDYIRTDGFIREAAYDRVRNLVYVSDWFWNRVQAISPATKKVVQEISLPRPWGLDLSADGTRLLVGTETDQLFVLDPGTFQVIEHHRLPALPGDSVSEFTTALSRQMANGKVLVLSANSLSGFTELIEWDLATNSASLVPLGNAINPSFLLKSTDGTRAVIGNALSPGGAVSYSSATDEITGSFTSSGFMFPIAIAPDGNHAVIVDEVNGLRMYDANLNPLFTVSGGPVGGGITGGVFSADGAKLYLELNSDFHPNLLTIDGHSGALFGIAPAMPVIPPFEELVPSFEVATPLAVDDTGLLFGSLDHGLAIEDTTFFQNLPAAVGNDIFLKLVAPNVGPVNATTRVTFKTSAFDVLPDVWFGSQRGLNAAATITASNPFGSLSVDAPPSATPGPVNVKAIQPNGVEVFDPLAFSYGPSLEFLNSTAGSPAGGETIHLLALGVPTDPTQVQVKFGTAAATVLSASPIGYGPFPNTLLKVSVPPGLPGPADVTITTATGSTTAPRAFRYMADVSDFPSQDRFQSILYDPFRDQVYLAAKSHIDVFSVQNRQFVTAFTPPGLNGTPNFGPLALTPDGSRLLAGNMQDPSVAVINPDAPLGAVAVSLPQFGVVCAAVASSFAVTNVGTAFVHLATPPGSICPVNGVDMLDLNTLQGSQVTSLTCDPGDVSASRDGNKVMMASSQFVYCLYDVATGTWSHPRATGFNGEGRLSSDGGVIWGGARVLDGAGNQLSGLAKPDALFDFPLIINNDKFEVDIPQLNSSGSLLFSPLSQYIDVFDARHGTLDFRIAFAEHLQGPNNFNPAAFSLHSMDISPLGDKIFLITDAGLTVVQLDAVPLSISTITPASSGPGTQITVRGSGFTANSTVSLNGSPAATTFTDSTTLVVTVPPAATGMQRATVLNLDGTSYSLDGAFRVP